MRLRIASQKSPSITILTKLAQLVIFICVYFFSTPLWTKSLELKFQRINTEQGLSQSGVSDIIQDDLGYLWFATQYGLNRFDGAKYDYFYANDKANAISSNHITRLAKDHSSRLWVLTSHGLDSINQKNLEVKNWSKSIFEQLVETNLLDKKNQGTISDFQVGKNYLFVLINFKTFVKVNLETEQVSIIDNLEQSINIVNGILLLSDNQLLLHSNNCFYLYDATQIIQQKKYCPKIDLSNQRFQSTSLQGDTVVMNVFDGLYLFNYKTFEEEFIKVTDSNIQDNIEASTAIRVEDGYWIGTSSGLKFYNSSLQLVTKEYTHKLSDDFSLSNNDVLSLYKSTDGVLWVGTSFGISILKPKQRFGHLLRKTETETFNLSNLTTSLAEDSNANLWVGTSGSGLYKYSKNKATLQNIPPPKIKNNMSNWGYVSKILEDDAQNLWVLANNGLSVKAKSTKSFQSATTFKWSGKKYSFGYMHDIIQDRYSNFWVGNNDGLFKIEIPFKPNGEADLSKIKATNYRDKLPSNYLDGDYGVYVIYEDLQGYIWTGGTNGLIRFNPSNLSSEHYNFDPDDSSSLSSSDVNVIFEDYNGVLWIGTTNGLNRVYYTDKGGIRFKRIGTSDGFISSFISGIQADSKGFIWLSTIKGIIRYHPSGVEPLVNYTYEQGLQHDEFYTKSAFTDPLGNIYFGGVNGITFFDPLKLDINKKETPIKFSQVSQGKRVYEINNDNFISLQNKEAVKVRISNFNYLSNRALKLRYRLSNESNWIEMDSNEIILHEISDNMTLEVQQQSPSGAWLVPTISLSLAIKLNLLSYSLVWPLLIFILTCIITASLFWLYSNLTRQKKEKELLFKREKAKQSLLMEEKLSLLHQVEDLHYSLSEQKYLVDKIQNELKQKNIKDEVTTLFSRGYIIKNIQHELSNIRSTWGLPNQKGIYLGVFCVEIDNFNALKELHGHIALNEILTQVAESITNICYGSDIIAKWQGASILILSRGISKREQMVLAEKIRNIIASRKFDLSNGKTIDITASIGFSRYPFLSTDRKVKDINWSKLIFLTEAALSCAQTNSLNAWIGIYSNQFTEVKTVEDSLLNELPSLVGSGQLDYVSSIPKSKKISWD